MQRVPDDAQAPLHLRPVNHHHNTCNLIPKTLDLIPEVVLVLVPVAVALAVKTVNTCQSSSKAVTLLVIGRQRPYIFGPDKGVIIKYTSFCKKIEVF